MSPGPQGGSAPEAGGSPWGPLELLIGLAVIAVWIARLASVDFLFINWADRDLYRSAALLTDWPTTGAEMNYGVGARVPGGFYHWLLGIPLAIRGEPLDAYGLLVALDAVAGALLAGLSWRLHGRVAGVATAGAYVLYSIARRPMIWLWNPTALPVFVALGLLGMAGVLTAETPRARRGAAVVWGGALALGGHAHMTSFTWLLWTVLGVALVRPGRARNAVPVAVGTALLTYVPYVLGEVLRGFPNTEAMMRQRLEVGGSAEGGLYFSPEELWLGASYLAPRFPDLSGSVAQALAVGSAGVVAMALAGAGRGAVGARGEDRWRVTAVVALGVAMSLLLPAVGRAVHVEWRYLLAATPGFALLVGAGVAWLARRAWWAGLAALAVLGGVVVVQARQEVAAAQVARATAEADQGLFSARTRRWLFQVLPERTGLDGAALVGRLAIAKPLADEDGWTLADMLPHDFALRQRGEVFPGSLAPPCHVVWGLPTGAALPEAEDLARLLGAEVSDLSVLSTERVHEAIALTRFDPGTDHCPTNLTGRYVLTPVEHVLRREVWNVVPDGQVVELPWDGGTRWAGVLAADAEESGQRSRVAVAVDVTVADGGSVAVVLRSNQLRGKAYNGGWYELELVADPRVVWTAPDGRERVLPIHRGLVGASHVVTPLAAQGTLPPGTWTGRLEMSIAPRSEAFQPWPFEVGPLQEVALPLGPLEVPGTVEGGEGGPPVGDGPG